jgi:hypothetical protein
MVKLIGILVLSSQLAVAVETDRGFVERSFPNSAVGAEQVIAFAEEAMGKPEHGVHIVVGWLNDDHNSDHILKQLGDLGIKHALAPPKDVTTAIAKHKLPAQSPVAVALSFRDRFPHLWQKKTNNQGTGLASAT